MASDFISHGSFIHSEKGELHLPGRLGVQLENPSVWVVELMIPILVVES
jgi:hypothetical protein